MKAFFLVIAAVASVIRSAPEWHYCYECSGQSALCRDSVYDGQYLSKTACSSTCFLRYEGETIYRGCFDGWLGGMVDHEYQGCQTQEYLGEQVEWCFCKGYDEEPCNSASRDDLSKLGPPEVKETPHNISEVITKTIKENLDKNSTDVKDVKEEFLHEIPEIAESPTDYDYKEETGLDEPLNSDEKINLFQIRYEDDWTNTQLDDPRVVRFEDSPKEQLNCVTCHDSSPFCQEKVKQTAYLTLTQCSSKCFLRVQDSKIYRGCFDGWSGTSITSDYKGCRVQSYMNTAVEWCFCDSPLCNTASIEELSGMVRAAPVTSSPRLSHDDKHIVESKQAEIVHRPLASYNRAVDEDSRTRSTVVGMCRGHQDGVYSDPYDCTRFVHCFNGFTYRRLCPPGTIWNQKRRNCDYPHSSNSPCGIQRWPLY